MRNGMILAKLLELKNIIFASAAKDVQVEEDVKTEVETDEAETKKTIDEHVKKLIVEKLFPAFISHFDFLSKENPKVLVTMSPEAAKTYVEKLPFDNENQKKAFHELFESYFQDWGVVFAQEIWRVWRGGLDRERVSYKEFFLTAAGNLFAHNKDNLEAAFARVLKKNESVLIDYLKSVGGRIRGFINTVAHHTLRAMQKGYDPVGEKVDEEKDEDEGEGDEEKSDEPEKQTRKHRVKLKQYPSVKDEEGDEGVFEESIKAPEHKPGENPEIRKLIQEGDRKEIQSLINDIIDLASDSFDEAAQDEKFGFAYKTMKDKFFSIIKKGKEDGEDIVKVDDSFKKILFDHLFKSTDFEKKFEEMGYKLTKKSDGSVDYNVGTLNATIWPDFKEQMTDAFEQAFKVKGLNNFSWNKIYKVLEKAKISSKTLNKLASYLTKQALLESLYNYILG